MLADVLTLNDKKTMGDLSEHIQTRLINPKFKKLKRYPNTNPLGIMDQNRITFIKR